MELIVEIEAGESQKSGRKYAKLTLLLPKDLPMSVRNEIVMHIALAELAYQKHQLTKEKTDENN